jgi:glycerol-3-phosphate cytidylyltransferase-like family protein
MKIYFPCSLRIATPGHIKCLKWLRDYKGKNDNFIIIGLLTDGAMKGYKEPIVQFKDRFEIIQVISNGIRNDLGEIFIKVVPQNTLDPSSNIIKYKPDAIASGDGWEQCELDTIEKYGIQKIDINLPKEYSSSSIINKIKYETNSSTR